LNVGNDAFAYANARKDKDIVGVTFDESLGTGSRDGEGTRYDTRGIVQNIGEYHPNNRNKYAPMNAYQYNGYTDIELTDHVIRNLGTDASLFLLAYPGQLGGNHSPQVPTFNSGGKMWNREIDIPWF